MAVVYSAATKTARMTAVRDTIDAGAGPGVLQIGTAGMTTILAEFTLNDPCGNVSGPVLTFLGFPKSDDDFLFWTVGNQARRKRQQEEDELLLALLI